MFLVNEKSRECVLDTATVGTPSVSKSRHVRMPIGFPHLAPQAQDPYNNRLRDLKNKAQPTAKDLHWVIQIEKSVAALPSCEVQVTYDDIQ
ncbi:hypothetical protein TNCV_1142772 [Trichonephila clavipes]|nr:hypothetical protein TNCV_1142772 [Trichonephila clavipes]